MDALLTNTPQIYAVTYFAVIIVLALAECVVPRRDPGDRLAVRWASNFGITVLNALIVRALLPMAGIAWAVLCTQRGWGLFGYAPSPAWVEYTVTIVTLDLLLYAQHRLVHRVPLLWRIHRTHHSDQDYDFSTAVRFHPLEALFGTALQFGLILAIGAPPTAVFLSQLISVAVTFIEHGNVRIPRSVDRALRTVVVTPDMHRVHHSRAAGESRANFSTTFSWWDRLFRTYVDQPAAGHSAMAFGLPGFLERRHSSLPWMLVQPFLPEPGDVRVREPLVDQPAPARHFPG